MGEVIDDTETGTIRIETPITCTGSTPHYPSGCALLKHYDADDDGKVTSRDALIAMQDGMTSAESEFILSASTRGSINALCPGCYNPARGEIVAMDVPASVVQGSSYDITAKTKNAGGNSGTFKMQLLINDVVKSTSAQFTLAAGATSTDQIPAATAPTSGTSMSYGVKCIRVT